MPKKGLVISWYFPPINSSEGICTFKLLKNSEFEYDVFTQKNDKSWSYDTNEEGLTSPNVHPIYADADNIQDWVKKGIEYGIQNREKYDFIMSRSMAPESHEIALAIKEKYPETLWIASFGDPITNNPYLKLIEQVSPYRIRGTGALENHSIGYVLSWKRILKNWFWNYRDKKYKKHHTRIYKDKILQDKVLKKCDCIIFNNSYQQDYMLENYPEAVKEKALLLPHGYDEDFYDKKVKESKDKKTKISYLGHLDETRTPKNFLQALERLREHKPKLFQNLEINIYGNMSDKDKVYLIDHELYETVKFQKPVKYLESLKIMQQSNLLLLVDANLGKVIPKNIFYAAKLADYIGSGRNIMAITMLDGPSADIVQEVGGVVSSHSVEDIYNNLVMILEGKTSITNHRNEKYNMKNIAKKFDNEVKKIGGFNEKN